MYPISNFQSILLLTSCIIFVHTDCQLKDARNRPMNRNQAFAKPQGNNQPLLGSYPQKPMLMESPRLLAPNQNVMRDQFSTFKVTVLSNIPVQNIEYSSPSNNGRKPMPQLPNGKPSFNPTANAPQGPQNVTPSPDSSTPKVPVVTNQTAETSSQDDSKGMGQSSIATYNVGSFVGLKIVSHNKISNENNGINNSPGTKLDNFTVNNSEQDGSQAIGPGHSRLPKVQNNGLIKSGSSSVNEFVVNNLRDGSSD